MSTKLPEGFKNVIIGLNEVMYSVPLAVLDEIERLTALVTMLDVTNSEQHIRIAKLEIGNNILLEEITEYCDDVKERIERIAKLEASLHQAYVDGGCLEDEATAMVEALEAK